jgi:hypothetical protein
VINDFMAHSFGFEPVSSGGQVKAKRSLRFVFSP